MPEGYNIAIIGLGFVGLSYLTAFSSRGVKVIGIDIDKEKIALLNKGMSPIDEPDIEYYLKRSARKGLVSFYTDYNNLKEYNIDIIFIAVDTPTVNFKQEINNLLNSCKSLGNIINSFNKYILIVVKSTILPGASRKYIIPTLEKYSNKKVGEGFGYVFNPEFLREGRALSDIFNPSRIVIGSYDYKSGVILEDFYKNFYKKPPHIIKTSIEAAELSKYASNLFLTCKLSFINAISYICQVLGSCDVIDIKRIMGLDERIGSKYLQPGIGFGGSCLPKDLKAFIGFVKNFPPYSKLFEAIDDINEYQTSLPILKAEEIYHDLRDRVITILGISYKGGTADIRGSRSLKIIELFLKKGAYVKIYDPKAIGNFKKYLSKTEWLGEYRDKIIIAEDIKSALMDSEYAIIATDWDEFKNIDLNIIKNYMRYPRIYDGRRILDPYKVKSLGIEYFGIGYSGLK